MKTEPAASVKELAASRKLPSHAKRRRLREEAGLTCADLAAFIDPAVTAMTVSRWERADEAEPSGKRRASYAAILRILEEAER